jgi:hypothetical protein
MPPRRARSSTGGPRGERPRRRRIPPPVDPSTLTEHQRAMLRRLARARIALDAMTLKTPQFLALEQLGKMGLAERSHGQWGWRLTEGGRAELRALRRRAHAYESRVQTPAHDPSGMLRR